MEIRERKFKSCYSDFLSIWRNLVNAKDLKSLPFFLLQNFCVPPDLSNWMFVTSNFSIDYVSRFIVYPFVNLSSLSVVFAAVLLLALGKMVGEVFSALSVILIWFLSTTLAAFFYSISATNGQILVGSYPGVYGFVGAYTFFSWITLRLA